MARVAASGQPVQVADLRDTQAYRGGDHLAVSGVDDAGIRTVAAVPMFRDKELVGVIAIYRTEIRPFADKQVDLVQNFAAQAVIAIENARLLNELRQRTDDLTESLEQQTATSEVLQVISSSPGDLKPVFEAMLENAVRICHAQFGVMHRFADDEFEAVAMLNIPPALEEFLRRRGLGKAIPGTDMDQLTNSKQVIHTLDMLKASVSAPPAKFGGARTQLAVPMLKDDQLVGAFAIYRQEVLPFTDKQIELVQNFAAQAVIAIENARLLNELRQRTDDLHGIARIPDGDQRNPHRDQPLADRYSAGVRHHRRAGGEAVRRRRQRRVQGRRRTDPARFRSWRQRRGGGGLAQLVSFAFGR